MEDKEENLIKKVCEELEVTQKELANILTLPKGTIGRWASTNDVPKTAKIALNLLLENKSLKDKLEIVKKFKEIMNLL